jgi:putative glutamine amidotransferase
MKPLVGICSDLVISKRDKKPKAVLDCGFVDGVYAAGGVPFIIPPMEREEVVDEYMDRIDGLLMTGGLDLNPQKLGKRPHPAVKPMLPRREEADRRIMKMAIEKRLPTLCVGVSMQLMNVMFGGTIHTHLPEDMPRALPHFDPHDATHRHTVFVTPATRLEEIYGEGEIRVNSNHHQGIRTLGKGLRSSALSPDGLVEAIETMDPTWWMLGVQWHPENDSSSALDRQLFEGFLDACKGKTTINIPVLRARAA